MLSNNKCANVDIYVIYDHEKGDELSLKFTKFFVHHFEQFDLKCYYYDRDATPGGSKFNEHFNILKKSKWVAFVVTPTFLMSKWSEYKSQSAFVKMIEEKGERLLPIGVGVEEQDMPDMLCPKIPVFFKSKDDTWRSPEAEKLLEKIRQLVDETVQESPNLTRTDQGMPVSQTSERDQRNVYQKVLDECHADLKHLLDPKYTLDEMKSAGLLTHGKYQDILDREKTSDKNEGILLLIRGKTEAGYKTFKDILEKTLQDGAYDKLNKVEANIRRERQMMGEAHVPGPSSSIVSMTTSQPSTGPADIQTDMHHRGQQVRGKPAQSVEVPATSLQEDVGMSLAGEIPATKAVAMNAATAITNSEIAYQGKDTPNTGQTTEQCPEMAGTPSQSANVPPQSVNIAPDLVTQNSQEVASEAMKANDQRDSTDLSIDYGSMPLQEPPPVSNNMQETPPVNNDMQKSPPDMQEPPPVSKDMQVTSTPSDSGYGSPEQILSPDQKYEDAAEGNSVSENQAEDLKIDQMVGNSVDNRETLGLNVQRQETGNNYITSNSADNDGFDDKAEGKAGGNGIDREINPDTRHGPEGQEASVGATAGQVTGEPHLSLGSKSADKVTPSSSTNGTDNPDKEGEENQNISLTNRLMRLLLPGLLLGIILYKITNARR